MHLYIFLYKLYGKQKEKIYSRFTKAKEKEVKT